MNFFGIQKINTIMVLRENENITKFHKEFDFAARETVACTALNQWNSSSKC